MSTIEIGGRFFVSCTRKNDQEIAAEIVDMRPLKSATGEETFEYYVHYLEFDKRMDEWVPVHRINASRPCSSLSECDISTKQKRTKRRFDDESRRDDRDEKEMTLQKLEKENEQLTKVKNVQSIVLGKFEIDTWYFSPFPDEFSGLERMFVCEYCLKYMKRQKTLLNHAYKCEKKSPPGRQIYADGSLSMFEIDGKDHPIYCQNLCLLSKLFLDHKTLYYDVDPFLFYVLCEVDEEDRHHIVGYFSKEKHSQENYNLACILTFPPHQRKGYGKFLISVSYEITKREGIVGSPEKPLSDLGRISYRSYWAHMILSLFSDRNTAQTLNVEKISRSTGIRAEDILSTLHSLNMIKFWKGQHVISANPAVIESFSKHAKRIRLCDPNYLSWDPPDKSTRSLKQNI